MINHSLNYALHHSINNSIYNPLNNQICYSINHLFALFSLQQFTQSFLQSLPSVIPSPIPSLIHFIYWRYGPTLAMASPFLRFLDHTQRRTAVGRTPLDEWSARRRDLYLTTHNTHNRQTSIPPVGFEPTISAGERPHTCALDRAATGTGHHSFINLNNHSKYSFSNLYQLFHQ